jgi:hypothetical protein
MLHLPQTRPKLAACAAATDSWPVRARLSIQISPTQELGQIHIFFLLFMLFV